MAAKQTPSAKISARNLGHLVRMTHTVDGCAHVRETIMRVLVRDGLATLRCHDGDSFIVSITPAGRAAVA